MKTLNQIFAVGILAAILTACGSQSTNVSSSATSGSSSGASTTASTTPTGNVNNLPAAWEEAMTITGATGATPTAAPSLITNCSGTNPTGLCTSKIARVKIKPLPAPNLAVSGYTNYVFPYGCLQLTVTVNGATKTTNALRVDGTYASPICSSADTSQILDFTGVNNGFGPLTVVVSKAYYDNCRSPYNPFAYGCGMSAIFQTHRASAEVTIQTDATYME